MNKKLKGSFRIIFSLGINMILWETYQSTTINLIFYIDDTFILFYNIKNEWFGSSNYEFHFSSRKDHMRDHTQISRRIPIGQFPLIFQDYRLWSQPFVDMMWKDKIYMHPIYVSQVQEWFCSPSLWLVKIMWIPPQTNHRDLTRFPPIEVRVNKWRQTRCSFFIVLVTISSYYVPSTLSPILEKLLVANRGSRGTQRAHSDRLKMQTDGSDWKYWTCFFLF